MKSRIKLPLKFAFAFTGLQCINLSCCNPCINTYCIASNILAIHSP